MTDELDSIFNKLSLDENKVNKGTGAGGKNTNLKGKKFEELTNVEIKLKDYDKKIINKSKFGYYLKKIDNDVNYIFTLQSGLKSYFKKYYDIELFRFPDESFIIETKEYMNVYIIEKKEQCVEGSVETKLWSAPSLKKEYEIILQESIKDMKIKVYYIFCLSKFLKDKFETSRKYKILKEILNKDEIEVLYGEDEDYFDKLQSIINF